MTTFFYFAYGSNMLTERLQARCPSAIPVGAARASGFRIAMTKKSTDLSGKATLVSDTQAMSRNIHGVIFEIHKRERKLLDDAEGPGYARDDNFAVTLLQHNQRRVTSTYIAGDDHIAPGLDPFCWYRTLIIAGAEQHGLPQNHIADLSARPFQPDDKLHRPSRKQAIAVLEASGFAHLMP